MDFELDFTIYIVAGVAVLLGLLLLRHFLKRRVDRFDDFSPKNDVDATSSGEWENPHKEKSLKPKKLKKMKLEDGSICDHHFEITGIPPDRIGTHVNLACTKCQARITVTVEESREILRQRDDVRDAIKRARGD